MRYISLVFKRPDKDVKLQLNGYQLYGYLPNGESIDIRNPEAAESIFKNITNDVISIDGRDTDIIKKLCSTFNTQDYTDDIMSIWASAYYYRLYDKDIIIKYDHRTPLIKILNTSAKLHAEHYTRR